MIKHKDLQKLIDDKLEGFFKRIGQKLGLYDHTKEETLVTVKSIDIGYFF